MKPNFVSCELCNRQANFYCSSDNAFLCFHCDFTVHNANFLVARHLRRFLCSSCNSLSGDSFSGPRSPTLSASFCRSCSPEDDSSSSSTVSSACVSSTETARRKRQPEVPSRVINKEVKSGEVEAIFGNWCKKLDQNGDYVISKARDAMEICMGKYLPYRVSLAASFWFGLKHSGNATRQNLRGLEKLSGVPGKLIVAVESKVALVLRARDSRRDLEEGWAECSV